MRRGFLIFAGIFLLFEFYLYQSIKTLTRSTWVKVFYCLFSLLSYLIIAVYSYKIYQGEKVQSHVNIIVSTFLVCVFPKIFMLLFLLFDDLIRLFQFGYTSLKSNSTYYPSRRQFLQIAGLGMTGVLSILFLDGILFGKYRHTVRHVRLRLKNTPNEFKGYRIIQISDVHAGSFETPEKLRAAIELINAQKPDLVLFTGDMVNNLAEEFLPFIPLFSDIRAKDGKFTILGNHDYGDYYTWENQEKKIQNLELLIAYQERAGFTMLRNQHQVITKNGEHLYLIGVENWGEKPFPQFGDLDAATKGIPSDALKILMSHDPTHFDHHVLKHPSAIQLTLSGHTHGMQFGIDLKNIKWSPVQYRYKKWADIYQTGEQYLYINRGFGVIGYPGRVGMLPEITLIELL